MPKSQDLRFVLFPGHLPDSLLLSLELISYLKVICAQSWQHIKALWDLRSPKICPKLAPFFKQIEKKTPCIQIIDMHILEKLKPSLIPMIVGVVSLNLESIEIKYKLDSVLSVNYNWHSQHCIGIFTSTNNFQILNSEFQCLSLSRHYRLQVQFSSFRFFSRRVRGPGDVEIFRSGN